MIGNNPCDFRIMDRDALLHYCLRYEHDMFNLRSEMQTLVLQNFTLRKRLETTLGPDALVPEPSEER